MCFSHNAGYGLGGAFEELSAGAMFQMSRRNKSKSNAAFLFHVAFRGIWEPLQSLTVG
jgi:hypothetical protein